MEIIGSVEGSETKMWFRCTRCRHSVLIDTSEKIEEKVISITRENCVEYSPEKQYAIGSSIYHQDWDDMGTVTAKEKTSSGGNAITVEFEKNGKKKLIENLPVE